MKAGTNTLPKFDALSPVAVKEQLRDIWHESFGDSYEFIDTFFATYPCEEVAHMLSVGARVVSVLYALPFTLYKGSDSVQAAYIYAVATRPEFRGRGYMSLLMSEVEQLLCSRGVRFLFLLPASAALRGYYSRLGFACCSSRGVKKYSLSGGVGEECSLSQVLSADNIYPQWVQWQKLHLPVVLHSRELIALNIASCRAQGGGCFVALRAGVPVAAAFVIKEAGSLLLLALEGCSSAACEWLKGALCRSLGVGSLSFFVAGGDTAFMCRWLCHGVNESSSPVNISLMLDK